MIKFSSTEGAYNLELRRETKDDLICSKVSEACLISTFHFLKCCTVNSYVHFKIWFSGLTRRTGLLFIYDSSRPEKYRVTSKFYLDYLSSEYILIYIPTKSYLVELLTVKYLIYD